MINKSIPHIITIQIINQPIMSSPIIFTQKIVIGNINSLFSPTEERSIISQSTPINIYCNRQSHEKNITIETSKILICDSIYLSQPKYSTDSHLYKLLNVKPGKWHIYYSHVVPYINVPFMKTQVAKTLLKQFGEETDEKLGEKLDEELGDGFLYGSHTKIFVHHDYYKNIVPLNEFVFRKHISGYTGKVNVNLYDDQKDSCTNIYDFDDFLYDCRRHSENKLYTYEQNDEVVSFILQS